MPSIGLNRPGEGLCDFCGATLADNSGACYFPARPFRIEHPLLAAPLSSGDRWYACAECRPYVEAADWPGLQRRVGLPAELVSKYWAEFADSRTGPPVEVPDIAAAAAEEQHRSQQREKRA